MVICLLLLSCLPILTFGENYIVVGGGISGLQAARTILNEGQGQHSVFVLEGRPGRYGGRVRTHTRIGFPVDLGATWLMGNTTLNPIYNIVVDQGIDIVMTDYRNIVAHNETTGVPYPGDQEDESYLKWVDMLRIWGSAKDNYGFDDSVRDVIAGEGLEETHYNDPIVLMWHNIMFEGGYAAPSWGLSARITGEDAGYPGEHFMFPDGYAQIADYVVNGDTPSDPDTVVDVRLDKKVIGVQVGDDFVNLTTADGGQYTADKVIVTVPLGVLKHGDIVFEPPLDADMQEAIANTGMGLLNKLVLEFDAQFWDERLTFQALAPEDEYNNGLVKDFWSLVNVTGRPVLMSWGSGEGAWMSEDLDDTELVNEALANLAVIFGDAVTNVVGYARTKWMENEFSRGSYYHPAVGQLPGEQLALGQPRYDCKVLFAGEHNSVRWGTVAGAYDTGITAAMDAMSNCAGRK